MPAFNLQCDKCEKQIRKILSKFNGLDCECGGKYQRLNKTSSVIKETLDNGVMTRKVERIHNIDDLVKERSKEPEKDDFV